MEDLFLRDFPEFSGSFRKILSDRGLIELLEDYSSCEKALNELQRLDKQKQEYERLQHELRLEIKQYIIKYFAKQAKK